MIPDSHAHLDLIEQDTASIVAQARDAGVSPIITIGITIASSLEAVAAAATNDGVYAAIGIHPNDTEGIATDEMDRLDDIASGNDRVVAIGETGLDYYRERASASVQKKMFRAHAELAKRRNLPLIVHDRQAHEDTLDLLSRTIADEVPVIMHCFSGGRPVLDECVKRGYYLSFAGPITFRNAHETRQMAALVPPDRLLCETDSPFLSPHPFRGKPNVPARVALVAKALAEARGVEFDEMASMLAANVATAFDIPQGG